jgi:ABC-type multidrug transport system permease subunit
MNAAQFTKKLRMVAVIAWMGSLAVFLGLAWFGIVPFDDFLPFWALLAGAVPIAAFMRFNSAICEICGGRMKISSGYPRIVYRCTKCGVEVDTGISSD